MAGGVHAIGQGACKTAQGPLQGPPGCGLQGLGYRGWPEGHLQGPGPYSCQGSARECPHVWRLRSSQAEGQGPAGTLKREYGGQSLTQAPYKIQSIKKSSS